MKRLSIIALFMMSLHIAHGQTYADKNTYLVDSLNLDEISKKEKQLIDSALRIYRVAKNDTSRLNAINIIVEESWDDNVWPKYNVWILKQCKAWLEENPEKKSEKTLQTFYLKYLASSINNVGFYYKRKGNISLAIKNYNEALKVREKHQFHNDLIVSYINLGVLYYNQGDDYKALDLYHKALKLQEDLGVDKYLFNTLNNIGALHKRQKDYDLAEEYYFKSLAKSKEANDKNGISLVYNNLGVMYSEQKKYEKSLEYHKKSLEIRKELGYKRKMALGLNNIGSLYKNLNQYEKAFEYYQQALEIYKQTEDKAGLATCYGNIGMLQFENGEIEKAQLNSERSLELAQEIGYPSNIETAAHTLTKIYRKQGKFERALDMYQLHIIMRDSINNEESRKASLKKEASYEYEKQKALDDARHEKEMAIKQEEKEKQQILTYTAAGGAVFLAVFLGFVFNRLKVTRKQKQLIEEQKQIVDEVNEELNQINEEILAQRDQIEEQKNIIEEKHLLLQDSIHYAKKIQQAILPKEEHVNKALPQHFILFKPRDIVSGDFYWADMKDDFLYVAVADCTGHGVPGAFMSMLGMSFLNQINRRKEILSPAMILEKLRKYVIRELKQEGKDDEARDGMDIALIRLNLKTLELEYSGAYNPLYLINEKREGVNCEKAIPFKNQSGGWEIKATKRPIGFYLGRKQIPFENHCLQLQKGDFICLFTDGFADQFGGTNESKYGYRKFKEILVNYSELPSNEIKECINNEFEQWKGRVYQTDDVCVIGIKF